MGLESDDIDIALDDMFGEEFAKLISQHINKDKSETGKQVNYGVIKANSEKSKHLETATIKINGVSIDLVNLRAESYSSESRVPEEVKLGTPTEDAYRRDLTINSLFYNINERKVEDFTGLGLKDLEDKIVRTPLEPKQTFMDDPLRLLRTIRFANRFEFTIHPDIFEAAKDPEIKVSFSSLILILIVIFSSKSN